MLVGKNSLYNLPKVLTPVSRKYPLFLFRAVATADLSMMSSQESVGESRVSHPASRSRTNSDADHFGPAMEEEMEADLMRVDAMEDQEVTSRFRAGFIMGELQSSAIPNSVIPSNVRFLSYENIKCKEL